MNQVIQYGLVVVRFLNSRLIHVDDAALGRP